MNIYAKEKNAQKPTNTVRKNLPYNRLPSHTQTYTKIYAQIERDEPTNKPTNKNYQINTNFHLYIGQKPFVDANILKHTLRNIVINAKTSTNTKTDNKTHIHRNTLKYKNQYQCTHTKRNTYTHINKLTITYKIEHSDI